VAYRRCLIPVLLVLVSIVSSAKLSGMVYPLYMYPSGAAGLNVYESVNNATESVSVMWGIVNPDNGDDNKCPPNSDWVNAEHILAKTRTLGYTHSSYGNRDIAAVKAVIANYYSCWSPKGIFIDEAANSQDKLSYYCELYAYIKQLGGSGTSVWINPGTNTIEGYINCADVIMAAEMDYAAWTSYTPSAWMSKYAPERFGTIIGDVTSANMPGVITKMASDKFGYGIVYSQSLSTAYTSTTLPTFWEAEVKYISS